MNIEGSIESGRRRKPSPFLKGVCHDLGQRRYSRNERQNHTHRIQRDF